MILINSVKYKKLHIHTLQRRCEMTKKLPYKLWNILYKLNFNSAERHIYLSTTLFLYTLISFQSKII